MENCILIDWLTVTIHGKDLGSVFDLLGIDPMSFQPMAFGRWGYAHGFTFDHISVYYDGTEDMGICVDMSGQGCRSYESYGRNDWQSFLFSICSDRSTYRLTRLDIAFDDHSGILDLDQMRDDIDDLNFLSKSRSYEVQYGTEGTTFYFGSKKSNILLRIYDKAMERGFTDRHWVRVELQLRKDNAGRFVENYMATLSIGETFYGVLSNYLRFVVPNSDSNKSRWVTAPYWQALIGDCRRIRLWSAPGTEYNVENLFSYVIGQAGNAIETYIEIFGQAGFMSALDNRFKRISPKYEKLKAQARAAGLIKY